LASLENDEKIIFIRISKNELVRSSGKERNAKADLQRYQFSSSKLYDWKFKIITQINAKN
jgi:hypothetical protein